MTKALVLAAGEGTRLRPLTLDRPKPMVSLGDRPLLEHLIGLLRHHGITRVAINLHYKPEVIVQHFGDGTAHGVTITYSHEPNLLGSSGAAKRLEWFLDGPFVVLYGDVLTDVNLGALIAVHRRRRALATIVLHEVPDPTRCGIAALGSDGRIVQFLEKPSSEAVFSNLANAGIYVLDPEILRYIPIGVPSDFGRDVFPRLVAEGLPIFGEHVAGSYICDIGSFERYQQAQRDIQRGTVRIYA